MSISMLKEGYWVSDGGRGEPKQVGRVTPCAPLCPPISRRARSDAPYPPSLRSCENIEKTRRNRYKHHWVSTTCESGFRKSSIFSQLLRHYQNRTRLGR